MHLNYERPMILMRPPVCTAERVPPFVPLGLELADEPGAGVGQTLVVDVYGILSGQDTAQAVRSCLFEQGQKGAL